MEKRLIDRGGQLIRICFSRAALMSEDVHPTINPYAEQPLHNSRPKPSVGHQLKRVINRVNTGILQLRYQVAEISFCIAYPWIADPNTRSFCVLVVSHFYTPINSIA